MAACRLLNFMNMYEVDFTAQGIAFVYMIDMNGSAVSRNLLYKISMVPHVQGKIQNEHNAP